MKTITALARYIVAGDVLLIAAERLTVRMVCGPQKRTRAGLTETVYPVHATTDAGAWRALELSTMGGHAVCAGPAFDRGPLTLSQSIERVIAERGRRAS